MQAISLDTNTTEAVTTLASFMGSRYEIEVAYPGDPRFDEAFALSVVEYQRHFGCHLENPYPAYFCLTRRGRLLAVCGFRSGDSPLFFLEQYLDVPAQDLITQRSAGVVHRTQLAELGGFAVRRSALAIPFMAMLAPALFDRGFTHAIATATLPVRRCIARMGVPIQRLADAHENQIADAGTRWGNYYQMRPAVVAGNIGDAITHFRQIQS